MPLSYVIDPTQSLVTITGKRAGADEWKALLARMLLDPRWEPGFAVLRDLRRTTPADADSALPIMEVVRQFWPHLRPARAAILTHDLDAASLTSEALAATHGLPIQVFTSYEAAVEWLREATGS
jgi:hypothetical protein